MDLFKHITNNLKEAEEEQFEEIDHKYVQDSDGFTTDYTMYKDLVNNKYVFVFGDKDVYRPEDGYYDWEEENEKAAREWFNSYNGFEDMDESVKIKESSYDKEDGKTDEQVYEEYVANEKANADDYYKRLCGEITDERREKFKELKKLIEDEKHGSDLYDGFYIPKDFVSAVTDAGKGHHLNAYMDLNLSDLYLMVNDNATIEDALKQLFEDYKADSAYSWGDNFLYALDKANPNAYNEYYDEAEEKKKPKKKYTVDDFDTLEDALNELKKVKGIDNYFTKEEWDAIDPDDINTCNYYIKDIIDNYLNESAKPKKKKLKESRTDKLIILSNHIKEVARELNSAAYLADEVDDDGDVFAGTEDSYAVETLEQQVCDTLAYDELFSQLDDDVLSSLINDVVNYALEGNDITFKWFLDLLKQYNLTEFLENQLVETEKMKKKHIKEAEVHTVDNDPIWKAVVEKMNAERERNGDTQEKRDFLYAMYDKIKEAWEAIEWHQEMYYEMDMYASNLELIIIVDWGDWKHDHAALDQIAKEATHPVEISENVTEEDGSDTYSAEHCYKYSDKQFQEWLKGGK